MSAQYIMKTHETTSYMFEKSVARCDTGFKREEKTQLFQFGASVGVFMPDGHVF